MEDEGEGRSGKAGLGLGWTFGGTATEAQDSLSDLACLGSWRNRKYETVVQSE